ncbi:hypothetical protein CPB84DRAFT_621857 [Gymnopilus junonius]|uniref:Uncharacterized protein n=1 Tax=Gymnopilus junonius TaxID=109634 RepID=A0A9P5NAQ6_GYMJU|nr:hypothetical protein CPB84DRAFT_621857 [Gymnopilus junonius]
MSQPAPRRPIMPSLAEAQQGSVTAQSRGGSSGSQAPMPVDKRGFPSLALDRRGFPVLDQRSAPRPALGPSRAERDTLKELSHPHHTAATQSRNPFARKSAATHQADHDGSPPQGMRRHASSPGPSSASSHHPSNQSSAARFGLQSRPADRNGSPPPLSAPIRKNRTSTKFTKKAI